MMGRISAKERAAVLTAATKQPKAKRGKASYREGAEQALFARRMALDPRTRDLPWSATMTGVNLDIRAAAMRKAQGVRRGVPDFLLFQRGGPGWKVERQGPIEVSTGLRFYGLALEFKNPDGSGRVNHEQQAWHRMLRDNAWRVEVVTTALAAWNVVADYLGFKP